MTDTTARVVTCPEIAVLAPATCCWPHCGKPAVREHRTTSPDGTVYVHTRCLIHPRLAGWA